jgi:hypothetical protein
VADFEKVYVVTMWSGGRPSKKWKSVRYPELLPQGTGVKFTCMETRLVVQLIGNVSVEEYEQGMPIPEWPAEQTQDQRPKENQKTGSVRDLLPDPEGLL